MRVIDLARRRRNIRPFFLDANGVTIKLKEGYSVGATGLAEGDTSGKVYTAVDNTTLFAMNPETDDYTSVCTTLCTNMQNLFDTQPNFNQNISNWDVQNVTNFDSTFRLAFSFNQDISYWNTSSALTMRRMFNGGITQGHPFNQDISNWNVSNVTNMTQMFWFANNFNQDLSSWCVQQIPTEPTDFATGATAWVLPKPNWGNPC